MLKRYLSYVFAILLLISFFGLAAQAEGINTAIVIQPDVRFREEPSGATMMKIKKGTKVNITGDAVFQDNWNWYPAEYNGKEGYLREDTIELSGPIESASESSKDEQAITATNGRINFNVSMTNTMIVDTGFNAENDSFEGAKLQLALLADYSEATNTKMTIPMVNYLAIKKVDSNNLVCTYGVFDDYVLQIYYVPFISTAYYEIATLPENWNIIKEAFMEELLNTYDTAYEIQPEDMRRAQLYITKDVVNNAESDTSGQTYDTTNNTTTLDIEAAKKAASKYLCDKKSVKNGTATCTFESTDSSFSFQYIYTTTDYGIMPIALGSTIYGDNKDSCSLCIQALNGLWALDTSKSITLIQICILNGPSFIIEEDSWDYNSGYCNIEVSSNAEMLKMMVEKGFVLMVYGSAGQDPCASYEAKKGSVFHNSLKYAWKVWTSAGLDDAM